MGFEISSAYFNNLFEFSESFISFQGFMPELMELSTVGKSQARHRSSPGSIPTAVWTDIEILVAVTYRCR